MKKKSRNQRIVLIAVGLMLAAILAFTMAACSLFTDAVTSLFESGAERTLSSQNETNENTETQDPENENQEQDKPGNEDQKPDDGGEETTEKPNQGGEETTDPGEEQTANQNQGEQGAPEHTGIVTFTSDLVYDKASQEDFLISATHENMNYYALFGAGLTSDTIAKRTDLFGSSAIAVDGEYLSELPSGLYELCYAVTDGYDVFYDYFDLRIANSAAKAQNVKIDYDLEYPNVCVTFTCDCGGSHTVAYDKEKRTLAAGERIFRVTESGDKCNKHTAWVKCTGGTTNAEKPSPASAVVSGGYLTNTYSFMGKTADKYIEDESELVHLYQYMIYGGVTVNTEAGISAEVRTLLNEDANAFLSCVQSKLTIPWGCQIGLQGTSDSNVVTFKVEQNGAGNDLKSYYENADQFESSSFTSHYEMLGERDYAASLPIDAKAPVTVRNVKELLAAVEAGYRPVAEGETLALYNKARNFCKNYVSDSMSEIEKLHVFYDYLAGEIKYDNSVLNLYSVVGALPQYDSLTDAKHFLSQESAKASNEFSLQMKAAIKEIVDDESITTVRELTSRLKEGYMQRLSAFSAEGVFNDGAAVCEGISYAFMLLSRIEGIECYQITGYATNGGSPVAHAWNKVKVGGKWYAVDATWGNYKVDRNRGKAGEEPDVVKFVSHRYFMVDESKFYESHAETIRAAYGVQNVASSDVEYYKGVETKKNHSLYIENYVDLLAAVKYYTDGGSRYMEFLASDEYSITSKKVMDALMEILKRSVTLVYSESDTFLAYYTVS